MLWGQTDNLLWANWHCAGGELVAGKLAWGQKGLGVKHHGFLFYV